MIIIIIGIEGGLGSGKTLLMTRYLVKDHRNGKKIYANYGLNGIAYERLDMSKVLDMHKNAFNLNDCSVGIDEITVFADCRRSGSTLNRMISYFILQSRKRNVDIYFTTQNLSMVDLRLVQYMDIQVICEKVFDNSGQRIEGYAKYKVFDLRDVHNLSIDRFILNVQQYYPFYNTNEVVLPLDKH